MTFNNRIKQLRIEKKLTQDDLAQILNFGRTAIANYESGRSEPSYSIILKLAEFFDVSIDYILGRTNIRNPYDKSLALDDESKNLIETAKSLSSENKKMLDEYIKLLKIKDSMDKSKDESSAAGND